MTVESDNRGRLYLRQVLREKFGERFHVMEHVNRIELIPFAEDFLEAVRDEIGDSLEGVSIEELRRDA